MRHRALFERSRHAPLREARWSEAAARNAIERLAGELLLRRQRSGAFERSPEDGWTGMTIYAGLGGIVWALRSLAQRTLLPDAYLPRLSELDCTRDGWTGREAMFERFDVPVSHSYLLGSVGYDMQLWAESRNPAILDDLARRIAANRQHPWMENLWGAPGTMIAAHHLYKATREQRFADEVRVGARHLRERLEQCNDPPCRLWNIELYGERSRLLGAGHGFVGNVFPVLLGESLLEESERREWFECIVDTVSKTALRQEGMANWPQSTGIPRRGRSSMVVQQCHGAPGIVIALASLMGRVDTAFDRLMLEAGELIWHAGPLVKYPGLCHGTAGNGYAFLKLYEKTQDELWLHRARQFAISALTQREVMLNAGRKPDDSLWEGDMGMAMFVADCLERQARFPTMDYFYAEFARADR